MSDTSAPRSNVPEFSVGELALSLKRTLEENYGRVRVRGELSRVSVAASGHMYSSLKDDTAVIDAVCWKGTLGKLSVMPEEGLEVICTGRISSYPKSSKYQLVIESMELAGEGALLKMLEERRKKLAAEGLFDESRKKELPFLPQRVGVVTSETGAVIRDILHRLADRFPRDVLLWPVLVQGDGAAKQIAAAIDGFQSLQDRPDVLIVGRGGGSLEDLMAFNEEIVVRAIANSEIPVISAVGHETDTTLADFAADVRAPTPTGAAEMAVPVRMNLIAQVLEDEQRLIAAVGRMLQELVHKLEAGAAKLGDPARILETQQQRLDHIGERIAGVFREYLARKQAQLASNAAIPSPQNILSNANLVIGKWGDQLLAAGRRLLTEKETRLTHGAQMLEAYSFKNILERGFTVIQDAQGGLITEAGQASTGQDIRIQFKDDKSIDATIGKGTKSSKKAPKKKKAAKTDSNQTELF